MNALYLTYDGLTDPLGQSQILPYLSGLSSRGVHFTIISFDKPKTYSQQKEAIQKIVNDSKIEWKSLTYTKNPPFLSTIYDIKKLKKEVAHQIRSKDISVIHCRSYITALVGLWAKEKYSVPFIFDMRGFWADERIDGNIWNLAKIHHKLAYNYFKKKEKLFLQEAIHTVSLTHAGKEEILSWNLAKQSPIMVIPCCTDELLFSKKNAQLKREELNLSNQEYVLSYLGSIGTWYLLDEMLDFFKVLLRHRQDATFLFITKDDKQHILNRAKEKEISTNKILVRSANRNEVPSYINSSDASIFFIKPAYSKKASSPTKMGEILNMGKPLICNSKVGDVASLMSEIDKKLVIDTFDNETYSETCDHLLNLNWDEAKAIKSSINYFSLEKGIMNYYKIYQSVG